MKTDPALVTESETRAVHGGDVDTVGKRYGLRAEEILDFSANTNPAGPPQRVLSRLAEAVTDLCVLSQYPEPACSSLRAAFATYAGVDPCNVIAANGTAALIDIALRTVKPKRCLLPVPAFSEYRRAMQAAGCEYVPFALDANQHFSFEPDAFTATLRKQQCDFCILTNPHNPSGCLIPPAPLLKILLNASEAGVTVLLDEAFIEYAIDFSLTKEIVSLPNVIVLRSITKFYALAGMRVGFAVANQRLTKSLTRQVPSWPVSTLVAIAAAEALMDVPYAEQSRADCVRERNFLSGSLANLGIAVSPSVANFLLLKLPLGSLPARVIYDRLLLNHRILARDCNSYEGLQAERYIRIAVKDRRSNIQLINALNDLLSPLTSYHTGNIVL